MKEFISNLKQLKEFNPAIIYSFEPEASITLPYGEQSWRQMVHLCNQQNDMLEAYLFAQNKLLPMIKNKTIFNRLNADHIISWLNQIHQKMAAALSADYKAESGKVAEGMLIQWRYGNFMMDLYGTYMGSDNAHDNFHNYFLSYIRTHRAYLSLTQDQIEVVEKFYSILNALKIDETIQLKLKDGIVRGELEWPDLKMALCQLKNLYRANELCDEEKIIVEKVLKFFPDFSERQQLMKTFAANLLERWKQCNPDNIDEVVSLAYFAFFNITETHFYFNGNGRTATCLMNIILRSMGKPSILMRTPGESANPVSSYNKAIQEINTNPSVFMSHVKERILAAEIVAYQDDELRTIIELRMKYSQRYVDVMNDYAGEILDSLYKLLDQECVAMHQNQAATQTTFNQVSLLALGYHLKHFDDCMLHIQKERALYKINQIIGRNDLNCGWTDKSLSQVGIIVHDKKEFRRIEACLQKANFARVSTQIGGFYGDGEEIIKKAYRVNLSFIDFDKLLKVDKTFEDKVSNLTASVNNCNL